MTAVDGTVAGADPVQLLRVKVNGEAWKKNPRGLT